MDGSKMKKAVSLLLSLVVVVSLMTTAFAADLTFEDVPSSDWAYDTIMRATELGLFKGTSPIDANGVGTFSPDKTMSRAEFITVCLRAANIVTTEKSGGHWYDDEWEAAVKYGLITEQDFGGLSGMEQGMTRQEMAYVLVNTLEYKGEKATNIISPNRIPDYTSVNSFYKPYVLSAYTLGLICGIDSKGTFSPNGTLNRAQGATVLIRLLEKEARQKVDTSATQAETPAGVQTWVEGERHEVAKAGDIVIKADGTRVVLEETVLSGPNAAKEFKVLGLGQDVDYWTGTTIVNKTTGAVTVLGVGTSACGLMNNGDRSKLEKHGNMVYSGNEWAKILLLDEYKCPKEDGSYYGEVRNHVHVWTEGEVNELGYKAPDYWDWVD